MYGPGLSRWPRDAQSANPQAILPYDGMWIRETLRFTNFCTQNRISNASPCGLLNSKSAVTFSARGTAKQTQKLFDLFQTYIPKHMPNDLLAIWFFNKSRNMNIQRILYASGLSKWPRVAQSATLQAIMPYDGMGLREAHRFSYLGSQIRISNTAPR